MIKIEKPVGTEKETRKLKTRIFMKGLSLYESDRVTSNGESEKAAYFIVSGEHEDYKVRIASDGTFGCTCMRGTLHGAKKGSICSHVVAAILHLALRSKS